MVSRRRSPPHRLCARLSGASGEHSGGTARDRTTGIPATRREVGRSSSMQCRRQSRGTSGVQRARVASMGPHFIDRHSQSLSLDLRAPRVVAIVDRLVQRRQRRGRRRTGRPVGAWLCRCHRRLNRQPNRRAPMIRKAEAWVVSRSPYLPRLCRRPAVGAAGRRDGVGRW